MYVVWITGKAERIGTVGIFNSKVGMLEIAEKGASSIYDYSDLSMQTPLLV